MCGLHIDCVITNMFTQIISWTLEEMSWSKLLEFEKLSAQNFSKLVPSLSLAVIHKSNYPSFPENSCTLQLWPQATLPIISLRPKDLNRLWIHQSRKVPRLPGNHVCSKRSFPGWCGHGAMLSVLNSALAIHALRVCWLVSCVGERELKKSCYIYAPSDPSLSQYNRC